MANKVSQEERRRDALASLCVGAVWLGPVTLALGIAPGPWWARGMMLAAAAASLYPPFAYHRQYGIDLRPRWPWKLIDRHWPDFSYSEGLGWFNVVGVLGILFSAYAAAWLLSDLPNRPWDLKRFSFCFISFWICLLMLASGLFVVTSRWGVFVYRESRTVTLWQGPVWPVFRKPFQFAEFTEVAVYRAPAAVYSFSHWRVWLREATNTVTIRARSKADAERIARQLAEVLRVSTREAIS